MFRWTIHYSPCRSAKLKLRQTRNDLGEYPGTVMHKWHVSYQRWFLVRDHFQISCEQVLTNSFKDVIEMLNVTRCLVLAVCFATGAFSALCLRAQEVKYDSDSISGLGARNIGSATMSGRIAALTAVKENGRITVYVGAASGGVWKSVNGGTTFKPMFDKQTSQSIGAIAIDPKSPKTIWAGTGESWTRNSVSIGDGIYKSTDGGENWTNMGLKESERIAKILIDPSDSNNVLACVTGHVWNDNDERGVFKTSDGGKTWKKVLAGANGSTGCGMLAMSPQAPKTIFASTWDFRRQGWTFRSGGPGSGLYQSTDGGDHWTELNDGNSKGLPEKPWGRIAVAIAP